jgi:hypothetical protein
MDIAGMAVQLVAGALAGNGVGKVMPSASLGMAGNSIVGGLGGVIVSQLLPMLMGNTAVAATGLDMTTIISGFVSGGVGGGITALVIGFIKSKMAK